MSMNVSARSQNMTIPLAWILRVLVSLVILGVIFSFLPMEGFWPAVQQTNIWVWGTILVFFLGGHCLAAAKWWMLSDGGESVSYARAVRAHFAGLVANLALPGVAGGDVVRAGLLFGEAQNRSRVVIGSLADRLLDSVGLLFIAAGALVYFGSDQVFGDQSFGAHPLFKIGVIFAIAAIGIVAFLIGTPFILGKFEKFPLRGLIEKVYQALAEMIRRPFLLGGCFLLSIGIQCGFILLNVMFARGIGLELSLAAWFFAWPLAKLIAVAPISIAGLGVREASLAGLLAPFGGNAALVVAASLLWQTILWAGGLLGGLAFLLSTKTDMKINDQKGAMTMDVETPKTAVEEMDGLKKEALDEGLSHAPAQVCQKPRLAVLGAGPAGAAAALTLSREGQADVVLLERNNHTGGNAGSFNLDGVWCDFGSHRLHPVADPRVLNDIRAILKDDLLLRPRHGRIRLQKRWIHFPLKPLDLLLRLPKTFTFSLALDTLTKSFSGDDSEEITFASVLRKGLGPTMSEAFYYPYVRKLWGLPPEELAVTLAEKRVSGSSVIKILQKISRQLPGLKTETSSGFYYPRKGFGQITEGLANAAVAAGTDLQFNADIKKIVHDDGKIKAVQYSKDGEIVTLETDAVWSTLPISLAVRLMDPPAPTPVLEAAGKIKFRGMILIYLVLDTDQFSEFDAHYFPELSIPISRMSEPKNYSASTEPKGKTVLCAELPCDPSEREWDLSDDELGEEMCGWLESVGLPVTVPVNKTITRRLGFAYPVYDREFEAHFTVMDEWLSSLKGFLSYGRQGLFAHDNTHHAMTMAYAAAECLEADGSFNEEKWAMHREEFKSHVVED